MTDDEKRELIAEARERYARAKASVEAQSPMAQAQMILVAGFVPKLLDALEGTLTEPEWGYGIVGHGYVTTDRYELDVAPGDLRRRSKPGAWEVVTDDRD